MKLHYSQTEENNGGKPPEVLLPYEITLLSNIIAGNCIIISVLLPYEITLLSNLWRYVNAKCSVLLPYEITLLSNARN